MAVPSCAVPRRPARGRAGPSRAEPGAEARPARPGLPRAPAPRLPLPKMAAPLAVNSGKNNLSVGPQLLLRLSRGRPASRPLPVLRLSSEPAEPGRRSGQAGRGEAARRGPGGQRGRAAGLPVRFPGCGQALGERPPVRRYPGSAAQSCPAMELRGQSCRHAWLVLAGSHGRQPRPPSLEGTVVTRCARGSASLRHYAHLLMLCGVKG